MNSIPKAIKLLGGLTAAGKALGVSKGVVFQWIKRDRIPFGYCPAVETLTGINCELLNTAINWPLVRSLQTTPAPRLITTPAE